jgi:hypothetical protein
MNAAEIWRLLQQAAYSIAACGLHRPSLSLGIDLPADVLRELATLSGGTFEVYRLQDDDSSLVKVHHYFRAVSAGVAFFAITERPATAADAHIPLRGGRS